MVGYQEARQIKAVVEGSAGSNGGTKFYLEPYG